MTIYDEAKVQDLIKDAYVMGSPSIYGQTLMLSKDSSPADSLEAAQRLLGPDVYFSHLSNGYPVYKTDPK